MEMKPNECHISNSLIIHANNDDNGFLGMYIDTVLGQDQN
jgi:hypothetical protein